ncbi:MAG: four helix bundle protein [Bacteroidetes bacterium]|nr:four helix bundle protein [Bacteroidota bacterium]MBL6944391.1 four helix bundle protein [Bacteroidales bacterium]
MQDFRKLTVYHRSLKFVNIIYDITSRWPEQERFGLISQINRASVSIPSNISEGSARRTAKDFARFIEIALGSAFEVETQLIISEGRNYISKSELSTLIDELTIIQKQLNALLISIRK